MIFILCAVVAISLLCGCSAIRSDSDQAFVSAESAPATKESATPSVKDPAMKELFINFVQSPNRETFLAVRTAVISSVHYDPYSNDFEEIDELVEAGKFDEASARIAAAMPNLLLSPRAHMINAFLAERSNDQQRTEMEDLISVACCEGILATGDGSKDQPYLVVRTSDEYDVIQYCQKKFSRQSLIHDGSQHFDLMEFEDGTEMWFDITDAYRRLEETFGDSKE